MSFLNLLQSLESFIRRCSRDISSYCDEILQVTLGLVSYDPNFTDNMEESIDVEFQEEDQYEYGFFCIHCVSYVIILMHNGCKDVFVFVKISPVLLTELCCFEY